jgi:predicted O-methyltransferase YrrM
MSWMGQSVVPESNAGWRSAMLNFRRSPHSTLGWGGFKAEEQKMRRSKETLDVLDFGAEKGSHGERSKVYISDLARRASSDLRKGKWLSAAADFSSKKSAEAGRGLRILELGTCLGSGASQLLHGCRGQVDYVGLEGSPALAQNTKERLQRTHPTARVTLLQGPFSRTLGPYLADSPTLDLVFLDGHHEGQALVDQWHEIRPFLSDNALVMVDDIRWSDDMNRAWKSLAEDPSVTALDLFRMGILANSDDVSVLGKRKVLRPPVHLWA